MKIVHLLLILSVLLCLFTLNFFTNVEKSSEVLTELSYEEAKSDKDFMKESILHETSLYTQKTILTVNFYFLSDFIFPTHIQNKLFRPPIFS